MVTAEHPPTRPRFPNGPSNTTASPLRERWNRSAVHRPPARRRPRARPPARAPAGLGAKQVVVSTHMSLEAGGTRIAISRLPQLCLRMGWFFRFESQASAYQHSIARPKNAPARLAATTVFAIGSTAAKRSSANAMATGMRAIPANRVASARTLSLSWPRAHRPSAGAAGARCWC